MKAFLIDRYGKNEAGRIGEVPEPEVRDDDVLVEIHAANTNVLDSKVPRGEFKLIPPYRLPFMMNSLQILKKGGHHISISGPPTPAFAILNCLPGDKSMISRCEKRSPTGC